MNENGVITYSRSVSIVLSNICSTSCNYYDKKYLDEVKNLAEVDLMVPYEVIKICKAARKKGVKEATLICGERPDQFTAVRSKLDSWGFTSFIEYIYTVCELCFLEGILPSIDIGYLNQEEVDEIRRITSSMVIKLENIEEKYLSKLYYDDVKTVLSKKFEAIKYAAQGKVPVTIKVLAGIDETIKSRKETFELIARIHEKYGHIQNVFIDGFVPVDGTPMDKKKKITKTELLSVVEQARKILPADIAVTVPYSLHMGAPVSYVKAGADDLGYFDYTVEKGSKDLSFNQIIDDLSKKLKKSKYQLQMRLPIFPKYIMENWYSRKLAQMLDKYKTALKASEKVSVE